MCLQDRTAEVRKAAQTILPWLIERWGLDTMRRLANSQSDPRLVSQLLLKASTEMAPKPDSIKSEVKVSADNGQQEDVFSPAGLKIASIEALTAGLRNASEAQLSSSILSLVEVIIQRVSQFSDPSASATFWEVLLTRLDGANRRLTETEAALLLPLTLLRKPQLSGDVSLAPSPLLRLWCRVYPASKLIAHLIKAISAADPAGSLTALIDIEAIVSRNGLLVLHHPREQLQTIIDLVAESEDEALHRALVVLVETISPMEDLSLPSWFANLRSEWGTQGKPDVLRWIGAALKPKTIIVEPAQIQTPETEHLLSPVILSTTSAPILHPIDQWTAVVETGADGQCLDAMQRLEEWFGQTNLEIPPVASLNRLADGIAVRLHDAFTGRKSPVMLLSLNILKRMAEAGWTNQLGDGCLLALLSECLTILASDEALNTMDSRDQLHLALNTLLMRILDSCQPPGKVLGLLIDLMRTKAADVIAAPCLESIKSAEMVMKCVWKMTKAMPNRLAESTNYGILPILQAIDRFLVQLPPVEWRNRGHQNLPLEDLPLRSLKTILHELVRYRQLAILDDLREIQREGLEQSVIASYVSALLRSSGHQLPPDWTRQALASSISVESQPEVEAAKSAPSFDSSALAAKLQETCQKICSQPETRSGLLELWQLRRELVQHPDAMSQIDAHLDGLGSFFSRYIRRNLAQLDAEQCVGITPAAPNAASVDEYRQKLVQMQRAWTAGSIPAHTPAGLAAITADHASSLSSLAHSIHASPMQPSRSRLDSPVLKPGAGAKRIIQAHAPPLPENSIIGLKERLAKLRSTNSSNPFSSQTEQQEEQAPK